MSRDRHRIRDAFEPAHDPESDADPFLLSHHLSTVEEALGWTVPTSAEECMMLFEIMYENEKDEFDICDKSSFRDRSTRFILENFLEGKERLKTK